MTPYYEDQGISDVAHVMEQNQVRRLVVLNRDTRLVGILLLGDLAVDIGDEKLAGHTLETVTEPAVPQR